MATNTRDKTLPLWTSALPAYSLRLPPTLPPTATVKPSTPSRLLLALALTFLTLPVAAEMPPPTTYVVDRLEEPLRAGPSNRHKVIGAVQNGAAVTVLAVDKAKGYTQVRSVSGNKGWIKSVLLTNSKGSSELLAETRQQLESLQGQHSTLKQHMDEVVSKPNGEELSYPQLYEEALRLRQQLAQYRKVAADTVALDDRNQALQERVVALERELQIIQQENQALHDENDNTRLLIGVLLGGVGLLAVVLIPKIRQHRRDAWIRL